MSALSFLPWLRRGAAAGIAGQDFTKNHASIDVTLTVQALREKSLVPAELPTPPCMTVTLHGPGDVAGIDPRVVIRTHPPAGARDASPEHCAAIEFSEPDFPWLFTPLAPDQKNRLVPWICLVVVSKQIATLAPESQGPSRLTVPLTALPEPTNASSQAWAWAHVQVLIDGGDAPAQPTSEDLHKQIVAHPERTLARMLWPWPLKSDTEYFACVVPVFEVGRRAGLGEPVEAISDLQPAWGNNDPATLPVYYHWEFRTGHAQSFEKLAAALRSPNTDAVGSRTVLIPMPINPEPHDPLFQVMTGALVSHEVPTPAEPLTLAKWERFQSQLKSILAQPQSVVPPMYGRYLGARPWLEDLNHDPAARVAASAGCRVVQEQQEALVASAWEQAGRVLAARDLLRRKQLAAAIGDSLHSRRFTGDLSNVAGKPASPDDVAPPAKPSGPVAYRRLKRSEGPVATRQRNVVPGPGKRAPDSALMAVLDADDPNVPIGGSLGVSLRNLLPRITLPAPTNDSKKFFAIVPPWGPFNGRAKVTFSVHYFVDNPRYGSVGTSSREIAVPWHLDSGRDATTDEEKAVSIGLHQALWDHRQYLDRFRLAVELGKGEAEDLGVDDPFGPEKPPDRLPSKDHVSNVAARLNIQQLSERDPSHDTLCLNPILFAPEFDQAMVEDLAELVPDVLLPGREHIMDNSVTLLKVNPRAVEAFLIGLNHEMARELQWRGFPVQSGATFFRCFWPAPPVTPAPGGMVHMPDPWKKLDAWTGQLGANVMTDKSAVLLLRGELVRQYPDLLLYARRASSAPVHPFGDPIRPVYRGNLGGDMLFCVFDALDATDGYYFVLEEQPTAPRFCPPPALPIDSTAATIAAAHLDRPLRVVIHQKLLSPPGSHG